MYNDIFSDALCISGAWDEKDDWHRTWAKWTVWIRVDIRSGDPHQYFYNIELPLSVRSPLSTYTKTSFFSFKSNFILKMWLLLARKTSLCVSYPSQVNKKADKPFDLVHFDVWSLCPLPSKLIFRYFVSFVGDYSRVTWIYLLTSRSEVFFTFKVFYSKIKNQFNSNIKILRTDNAKKYMDNFRQSLK